jgi:Zn-dependent oligopeptidase
MRTILASSLPRPERTLLADLSSRLSGWKTRNFTKELSASSQRRRTALLAAASSPASPTFENTCLPLEMLDIEVDAISADFNTLLSALRPARLVSAEKKIVAALSKMEAEDMEDNRLALRLRKLRRTGAGGLDPRQRKLLEDHYRGFLLSGYYLPPHLRKKLTLLSTLLAKLESSYARAASKERKYVIVRSVRQLEGLSDTEIAEFRSHARKEGKVGWAIPLEPTQHQPITSCIKFPCPAAAELPPSRRISYPCAVRRHPCWVSRIGLPTSSLIHSPSLLPEFGHR